MYAEEMLHKILLGREKRAEIQKKLIEEHKCTLVSFTLNVPGMDKLKEDYKKVHEAGVIKLEKRLSKENIKVNQKLLNCSNAGYEAFFCIALNAKIIKNITVDIEEEDRLGRLFDFDVFADDYRLLSRTELGLPKRKCLICNNVAAECSRSQRHSIEEVLKEVDAIINNYNI